MTAVLVKYQYIPTPSAAMMGRELFIRKSLLNILQLNFLLLDQGIHHCDERCFSITTWTGATNDTGRTSEKYGAATSAFFTVWALYLLLCR